jgi:hypothetical protein
MSEDETSLLRRNEMQYTLMFYMSPSEFSARTDPAKKAAFWGAFLPYMQAVRDAGIFKNGAGLGPPEIATTVRVQNGKRAVQDGAYADTKEQLGGFFIIEAPDLDTALDWAARYPAGPSGVVEVRPNISGPPDK